MNRLFIIGNLTRDPELRSTPGGAQVCSFTVAVNRRKSADGQQEADFFRVSAWNQLGQNCKAWLTKGRKVAVTGPVSVRTYQGNDGKTYASLEVMANDVEFLTPKNEAAQAAGPVPGSPTAVGWVEPPRDPQTGFTAVETDDLPF